MDKPTISVNIIAKNEEKTLPMTVECIREFADEIVIGVDRSSTDKTHGIAQKLADVFYELDWRNSFSQARNFSMGKCTKEWILILDAHEFISPETVEKFNHFWKTIPDGSTGVGVKILMENDMSGVQMRFLKNNAGWKWEGKFPFTITNKRVFESNSGK